jgi:hypothetical protein
MEAKQLFMPMGVKSTNTAEGTIVESTGYSWPDGPMLRVRDGDRDTSRLPDDVLSERAVILEVRLEGTGWNEISSSTYVRFLREDDGKIGRLVMTSASRKSARGDLVQQAVFQVSSMLESSCWE